MALNENNMNSDIFFMIRKVIPKGVAFFLLICLVSSGIAEAYSDRDTELLISSSKKALDGYARDLRGESV